MTWDTTSYLLIAAGALVLSLFVRGRTARGGPLARMLPVAIAVAIGIAVALKLRGGW